MGLISFLAGRSQTVGNDIIVDAVYDSAAAEFVFQKYAVEICVNMIADTIGRCEFRVFVNGEEQKDREYYLWNIRPNVNQNASAFMHELIYKLCMKNEVLIFENGDELFIADSFVNKHNNPTTEYIYTDIIAGDTTIGTRSESEVIHLKLNNKNIKNTIDSLYLSIGKVMQIALESYEYNNGEHYKVHIETMKEGAEGFEDDFTKHLEKSVKPFLKSSHGILPEFDGFNYENIKKTGSVNAVEIREIFSTILSNTARAFGIPAVLINNSVEGTAEARKRYLTECICPKIDMLQEEINAKRYTYNDFIKGNRIFIDTTSIEHFDILGNAGDVEKAIGSGVFSVNDILKASGLPTIAEDWADEHMLTKNFGKIDDR